MVYIQQILVFLGLCSILETTGLPPVTYRMPQRRKQLPARDFVARLFDGYDKGKAATRLPVTTVTLNKKPSSKRPEWGPAKDKARRKIQISHRSDDLEKNATTGAGGVPPTTGAGGGGSSQTPWVITPNKDWPGPNSHGNHGVTRFRIKLDTNPVHNYVPFHDESKLKTVCLGRSTILNDQKVMKWLNQGHTYWSTYGSHPYDMKLRRLMLKKGESEQCHTPEYNTFSKFINCAIKRQMRMESLIPKYPLHQIGNPHIE